MQALNSKILDPFSQAGSVLSTIAVVSPVLSKVAMARLDSGTLEEPSDKLVGGL